VETRVGIRWKDCDGFGHVNNAVFLTYLEEGRDRLLESVLGDSTWDLVLARVAVDYRAELLQADREVVVECQVAGVGRSSIRTREVVRTASGAVAAEAESVMVARDRATGRSRPLTDGERAAATAATAAEPGP
jgi:acyl-CoA thioester hydrolase